MDNVDVKLFNLQWLRRQIGLVSQEPILFDATIADNIRFGANFRDVTDEEVETAAKNADIHDFIMSLPQVCHHYPHICHLWCHCSPHIGLSYKSGT